MAKAMFLMIGCGLFLGVVWTFLRPLWREGFRVLAAFVGLLASTLFAGLIYFLLF